MKNLNVLIPMAGLGSRFADAGYKKPKPLIDVNGVPMIKAVVDSLNLDAHYIFIVQKQHSVEYHLLDVLDEIAPGCSIVEIDGLTEGAASTTLLAKHLIDNETSLVIANSDQIIEWDSSDFASLLIRANAIAVFTDKTRNPKWSYVEIQNGTVTSVHEKVPVSDFANVGIYGWSSGSDYVKYAEQMIAKDVRTNGEFYIAPVYNEPIAVNDKVTIPYFVNKMYGVGTPEDLKLYLDRSDDA